MKIITTQEEFWPNAMERIPYLQIKMSNDFNPFVQVVVKIYKSKTHIYFFDGKYHLVQKTEHENFNIIKAMRAVMVLYDLRYSDRQLLGIADRYEEILKHS